VVDEPAKVDDPAKVDEAAKADDAVPSAADWSAAAEAGSSLRAASGEHALPAWSPASTRISAALLQDLIDDARMGYPEEACGILAGDRPAEDGGGPTRYVPMRNAAASGARYLMDPEEQLRVMLEIDDAGEVVWGIFHSHVASPPEPSATDIGLAFYPDSLYLICSLAGEVPVIRGWSIRDGRVTEVVLEVG
jgi:[CysO sulfur-carrier protein]-S-L-cysteine hydrolase